MCLVSTGNVAADRMIWKAMGNIYGLRDAVVNLSREVLEYLIVIGVEVSNVICVGYGFGRKER